ncbi:signal peptidase II [Lacipirellula limnantheis]|uniref:Lipoprotein signal peptidase n=1 Tax=Lacipirellula limnantheis TaxID=2528024 RepID=A0A517U2L4_9BACT|nr:signal peptidase II [Lacipirellula limnantheis]QDT74856.1 lipoprotein signal peptidase [Lacipirellula limnantheis]
MDQRAPIPFNRHLTFWALACLGCAADLWSKHYMFSQPDLLAHDIRWMWEGHAGFQLSLNEGALFGMGQGNVWVFASCATAAAVAIPVWLFVFGAARDRGLTIALGCILGGVIGNLYDRLGLPGLQWANWDSARSGTVHAVRDFVLIARRWPPQGQFDVWPNFNVADSLLVCGAIALFLISWRRPDRPPTPESAVAS